MMHLMRYKIWFFIASTLIIIPGLVFIFTFDTLVTLEPFDSKKL